VQTLPVFGQRQPCLGQLQVLEDVGFMSEQSATPFNQQDRVFGDPVAAAQYDKQIFDAWVGQLENRYGRSSGLDILELGPGITLGTQLLLVGRGNRVTVADPYPPTWHPGFHPVVYGHLAELVGGSEELQRAAEAGSMQRLSVRQIAEPAENLRTLRDGEFDVVLSNAVLEHVRDLDRVSAELSRVTKPGGINIHQIDLGYHKSRERPLDHLLLTESEFFTEADAAHFEYGNRWRASEFVARFQRAGLEISHFSASLRAEPGYLIEVHGKIREKRLPYGTWPAEDMGVLSMLLVGMRGKFPQRLLPTIQGKTTIALHKLRKFRAAGR
jgi:SAM-dependent methyltransferase